jgi:hypothetical protein
MDSIIIKVHDFDVLISKCDAYNGASRKYHGEFGRIS